MTLARAALRALLPQESAERDQALALFYDRWKDKPVILDAWFAMEASAPGPMRWSAFSNFWSTHASIPCAQFPARCPRWIHRQCSGVSCRRWQWLPVHGGANCSGRFPQSDHCITDGEGVQSLRQLRAERQGHAPGHRPVGGQALVGQYGRGGAAVTTTTTSTILRSAGSPASAFQLSAAQVAARCGPHGRLPAARPRF